MKNLIEQMTATVREHKLFSEGEHVLVGFSGGADSAALVHGLKFGLGIQVTACHLNHCLRGDESDRDEALVRKLCASWKIPCFVFRADVGRLAKENGISVEMAGREARYAWFCRAAAECGASVIATAHTRSDQTETFLLHLVRGSGSQGLGGIPFVRTLPDGISVVRPLLDCSRQMVEEYCREEKIPFVTDSTNVKDVYTRNKIRHAVLPVLREINPAFDDSVARLSRLLEEESQYLNETADELLSTAADTNGWRVECLTAVKPALRRRAMYRLLGQVCGSVDFQTVDRLCALLETPGRRLSLPGGRIARVRGGILKIAVEKAPLPSASVELTLGECVTFAGQKYRTILLEKTDAELPQKVQKKLLYLTLDYDTIDRKLYLRSRLPGDAVSLAGHNGSKSLKKLFIDAALTAYEKSAVPILADESGVAAVYGFGPAARCGVTEQTKQVLLFGREEDIAVIEQD